MNKLSVKIILSFLAFAIVVIALATIGYRNIDNIRRDAKDVSTVENFEIISFQNSSWSLFSGGSCWYHVKTKNRPDNIYLVEIKEDSGEYSVFFAETVKATKTE